MKNTALKKILCILTAFVILNMPVSFAEEASPIQAEVMETGDDYGIDLLVAEGDVVSQQTGNKIIINGKLENPKGTETVTLDIYYPNKSFSDLLTADPKDYTKILLYRNDTTASVNGSYSFECPVGDIPTGRYTARIGRSFGEVKTKTIGYINPKDSSSEDEIISSVSFGNIFYTDDLKNDNVSFKVNVPLNLLDYTKATINFTVKTFDGETVYEKEGVKATSQSAVYELTDFDGYGVFDLTVDICTDGGSIISETKDFSVLNTEINGQPTKKNPKVNIHELFRLDGNPYYIPHINDIMGMYEKIGISGARGEIGRGSVTLKSDGTATYTSNHTDIMNYYNTPGHMGTMVQLNGSKVHWAHVPVTDDELSDYANYCKTVAKDTKDYAFAYELWNEPNVSGFNKDNATPAQYAKMVKVGSEAIRTVNENAKIVAMTTSHTPLEWIKQAIDGAKSQGFDLKDYIDVVSVHPYMWGVGPEKDMVTDMQAVRKLLQDNGLGDKEVWATEIGWQRIIGLDRQAYYTTNYLLLSDVYGLAEKSFLFRYAATKPAEGNEEFGLLNDCDADVPFSARPQLAAVANYNRIMSGAEYISKITVDGTDVYRFKLADNREAAVFYTVDKNSAINLDLGINNIIYSDMYGNEVNLKSSNGVFGLNTIEGVNYAIAESGTFAKFQTGTPESYVTFKSDSVKEGETGEFSVVTKDNQSVNIQHSQNVEVTVKGNPSDFNYYFKVTDFADDKPCITIEVYEDGKLMCYRHIFLKEAYDDNVVYHAGRYNYETRTNWNIYNMDYSEERQQAFRFTGKDNDSERYFYPAVFDADDFTLKSGGRYKVSYDLLADDVTEFTATVKLNMPSGGNVNNYTFAYMRITEDGNIGFYTKAFYGGKVDSGVPFEKNRWYHFDTVFDFSKGVVEYYIDGKYITSSIDKVFDDVNKYNNNGFTKFDILEFYHSPNQKHNLWMDDIEIRELKPIPFDITVSGSNYSVKANASTSSLMSADTAKLICGVYDENGKLINITTKDIARSSLKINTEVAKGSISADGKIIKVFAFKDMSTLSPVCESVVKAIK